MPICMNFRDHVELHHKCTDSKIEAGKNTGHLAQLLHHITGTKKNDREKTTIALYFP